MTCETMLLRMLDAEPGELRGEGTTPLAAHLRECRRCRAVAAQLAADGARVAAAVRDNPRTADAARPGRSFAFPGRLVLAGTLAAAVVGIAVLRATPGTRPHGPAPIAAAGAPPVLTRPHAAATSRPAAATTVAARNADHPAPPSGHATRAATPRGAALHALPPAVRLEPDPLPAARPLPAAPVDATPQASASLAVRPPTGVRTAVFQTENPAITVVWLY